MNHRDEVHGQLLEARAQTAALLEPAGARLDGAAAPVEVRVRALAQVVRVLVADFVASHPFDPPRLAVHDELAESYGLRPFSDGA